MSNQNENQKSIVRQMKVSPMLTKILNDSLNSAKNSRHEFLTPEHVLLLSLENEFVWQLLKESGSDCDALKLNLSDYIQTKVPCISKNVNPEILNVNPVESVGFQSVMNRSVFNCVSSESDMLDITDVIVSMYEEKTNYCSYYLRSSGLDRLKLLETITKIKGIHGTQKRVPGGTAGMGGPGGMEGLSSNNGGGIERFSINLTELVKKNGVDDLIGREEEIERTIQVLCRRTKNNPLHVGDAGVGKTAITYGLAKRIVEEKVPALLKGYTIYSLDLGLLLAGSKFRGDFEERLHSVIDDLKVKKKAILFIDEIHMLMGAGTNGNTQMDAANLLKPVLATGEIKCIGSTTFEEYSSHFEKDRALSRRFQKIDINEPSKEEAVKILKGLQKKYEDFHHVKYTNAAIVDAVNYSLQYIPDRHLPDKAIDVLDEAGSYLSIAKNGGFNGTAVIPGGSKKLVVPQVNSGVIKTVIAKMVKLPVDVVNIDERQALRAIEEKLGNQIFGQEMAIQVLAKAVKRARAGFRNPERPEACYLFVGPTGCGKTELAKCLSSFLNEPLLRYDMSEYQEKHSVSRFVGSPPGYVGFEEGGQLTKDVRKNPHAIILFDEIEKAHQDIYNILLQIMDYGVLTDNQGRKSDFRSCMIIMTSNAGARDMEKPGIGFGDKDDDNEATLTEAVNKEFSPEFRNRLDAVIPFKHLGMDVAKMICKKEIGKLAQRMKDKGVELSVTDNCVDFLTKEGYSKEFGARNMTRVVEDKIANPLVDEVLFGKLEKGGFVTAEASEGDITFIY